MINRKFFFDYVRERLFAGKISTKQYEGLELILKHWDISGWPDTRWLAYMLATTYHETALTMQPIAEYGKGKGRSYGVKDPKTGQIYYGRGYVQLTWKRNYELFAKELGIDLVNNPDIAMQPQIAIKIMFTGMGRGSFTGKKLSDYFLGTKEDWVGARKIINGTDRAQQIAVHAKHFYAAINTIIS